MLDSLAGTRAPGSPRTHQGRLPTCTICCPAGERRGAGDIVVFCFQQGQAAKFSPTKGNRKENECLILHHKIRLVITSMIASHLQFAPKTVISETLSLLYIKCNTMRQQHTARKSSEPLTEHLVQSLSKL